MTTPWLTAAGVRRVVTWSIPIFIAYLVLQSLQGKTLLDEGVEAPTLLAQLDNGTTFDLRKARGHTVVLNFWATYCEPCRREAPELSKVHQRLQALGGEVVGIAVEASPLTEVAAVGHRLGMVYPIGSATADMVTQFRVNVVPTTYVIAPDGKIVFSRKGGLQAQDLDEAIREAQSHTP